MATANCDQKYYLRLIFALLFQDEYNFGRDFSFKGTLTSLSAVGFLLLMFVAISCALFIRRKCAEVQETLSRAQSFINLPNEIPRQNFKQ